MIIDIIGYFFAFIFLSKMLAIPFVGYLTFLSSHINITKKYQLRNTLKRKLNIKM